MNGPCRRRRDQVLPFRLGADEAADLGTAGHRLVASPQHVGAKSLVLEARPLRFPPLVVDGEQKLGLGGGIVFQAFRKAVRERNDAKGIAGNADVDHRAVDHVVTFIEGARIGEAGAACRIGRFDLDLRRVRIGDADDQQLASFLPGEQIFHMPDVQRLEATMNDGDVDGGAHGHAPAKGSRIGATGDR